MNTDQLRLFLVIARHRSLTRTAVELDLGQATVSERLRALEAEVGTRLFERRGRGVTLTPAGEAFRPYAERGLEVLRQDLALKVARLQLGRRVGRDGPVDAQVSVPIVFKLE